MPPYDFRSARLFVEDRLHAGAVIELDGDAANYLRNVLRLKGGAPVLLFNGRDGEWRSVINASGKRTLSAAVEEQTRPQPAAGDLHYLFAPLKHVRLDYMVQKAVELGVSRLQPVITRHTQVVRVNIERMRANAIEAAQQCGVLALPEVKEEVELRIALAHLGADRLLVFCDEGADIADPIEALIKRRRPPSALVPAGVEPEMMPLAVLIGPEGGFAEDEREALLKIPNVVRLALGPRILRADTAAVAALALVQSVLGDWVEPRSGS
ncbi:MAG: 16S rRNA (uracil(1498)-N(3))-methyltransferase [Pseudolabrys sp.]|nr:16S rRNA (uracil(1498)-N(3))-methyltransferase [Pseudolabrys sp.]